MLLIIQLLLKALTTPLVLRAPDHPAAVCTRPTIISYRVCMCVCMRVSTRLYLPTTTTEYVCVCVCVYLLRVYLLRVYLLRVYLLCMRVSTPSTQNPDERVSFSGVLLMLGAELHHIRQSMYVCVYVCIYSSVSTCYDYRVCMCMRMCAWCRASSYPTEYVCVCVCVYLLVCIYLLRLQSMYVCAYVCIYSVCIYSVCIYSVCIYCVCVYLLHLLKTLTNAPALIAPALIAPTQLLAASGRGCTRSHTHSKESVDVLQRVWRRRSGRHCRGGVGDRWTPTSTSTGSRMSISRHNALKLAGK